MFERQKYEKRISRVSEVYPTEKVSDLFDKFPGGFSIYHKRGEVLTDNAGHEFSKNHIIMLYGDPDSKSIKGQYEQEIGGVSELTLDVSYSDIEGLTTTEDYQFEPIMQNFSFLFQKLNLSHDKLKSLDFLNTTSNPVTNSFGIRYNIKDEALNQYFNLPAEETLEIKFHGNNNEQNNDYQTSFTIDEGLKKPSHSETVTGFE